MKDRKSAVLAAIDDNWRHFRDSLDQLISEDMLVPEVTSEHSVADIVGHVTYWESELVSALGRGSFEQIYNIDHVNNDAMERKKHNLPRETVQEMDKVHRELRDMLSTTPRSYFEPDEIAREMIDSCTVLHYQEHGTQIRIWMGRQYRTDND